MNNFIHVLIADDRYHEREGIKQALALAEAIEVVGEASSAQEALSKTITLKPNVVLMDLDWYGDRTAGITAIKRIKQAMQRVRILVATNYPELIDAARAAGAEMGVNKSALTDSEAIAALIRDCFDTGDFHAPSRSNYPAPSERECQVLWGIARGWNSAKIAEQLDIAEATVKRHKEHLFQKLEVSSGAEAVFRGFELGLIPPKDQ